MRVSRAKLYRKYLRFYRICYNVHQPYKVLVDGPFLHACLRMGISAISERVSSVLQGGRVQMLVPPGVVEELEVLGEGFVGALRYARSDKCRIVKTRRQTKKKKVKKEFIERDNAAEDQDAGGRVVRILPSDAILELVGERNEHGYIVATQDESLRRQLGGIPGCPLLYQSRAVIIMEPPSGASKATFERHEREKAGSIASLAESESSILQRIKKEKRRKAVERGREQPIKRLKKVAKAPNPLSCKVSTKKTPV